MPIPQFRVLLHYPSAVLLLVQLAGVVLYPLMEQANESRIYFSVFGVIVLGLALRMVRNTPGVTWIALALASSIVLLFVAHIATRNPTFFLLMTVMEAAFYFYAAGCLIAYMLQDDRATTDELFAAGATFTLIAWAFAYVYMVCQLVNPASFVLQAESSSTRTWMELLFLSFTCLSGVGLGDIMPLQPMARALVMLEEFAGVMYIALVVSRLIGLTIRDTK